MSFTMSMLCDGFDSFEFNDYSSLFFVLRFFFLVLTLFFILAKVKLNGTETLSTEEPLIFKSSEILSMSIVLLLT